MHDEVIGHPRPHPRPHNRRRAFIAGLAGLAATAGGLRTLGNPVTEGPLFVRRKGANGSPILCLHGLFGSSAFWGPLADDLSHEFQLTMPDLVGFGHSPQPEADYTVDFHLQYLEPLLARTAGWIVAGHSMGCGLATAVARRWPDAVAGVALFNAPVYSSVAARREIFGKQNLLTRLSLRSPVMARVVCEATVCIPRPILTAIAPRLRPDVPPESASDYFRHTFTSYHTTMNHVVMEQDLLAEIGALRQPTIVVQGAQDNLVEAADRLRWPVNAEVRVVPGVDHTSLLLQQPESAAAILREFLGAVRGRPFSRADS
jgi:pimeloyl-ACP methyl ester carboxylesterase